MLVMEYYFPMEKKNANCNPHMETCLIRKKYVGNQGGCSGQSTCFPPVWPRFKSWDSWVHFLLVLFLVLSGGLLLALSLASSILKNQHF